MKLLYIFLAFTLFQASTQAQDLPPSVNKVPLVWSDWEIPMTAEEKLVLVQDLNITLKMEFGLDHYSYTIQNILEYFHVVDFNKDGYFDIIYNGFAGTNNNGIILFENQDGKFKNIITLHGNLVEIWQNDIWSNLSFKLYNYRCCGGFVNFIETYNPQLDKRRGRNLRYEVSDKLAFVFGMEFPLQFTQFKPMIVSESASLRVRPASDNEFYDYKLKTAPVVDINPQSRLFKHSGNVIAKLEQEATGFILAEKVDIDGQLWYCVMMKRDKVGDNVFCNTGHNNTNDFTMLGWIRSDEVEILDYFNE